MKKLFRLMLACTLLLLAAVPAFAAPPCTYCDEWTWTCELVGYSTGERCRYLFDGTCETYFGYCYGYTAPSLAAVWDVSSIEISRPAADVKLVTPSADLVEVRMAQPAAE